MASTRTYRWQSGDQIWMLAARLLHETGYSTVSELVEAIRTANPQVLSWSSADVPSGAVVTITYLDL